MKQRNKAISSIPWYFVFPLVLVLFETVALRFFPFSSPYFVLLFPKQPIQFTWIAILSVLRTYGVYLFYACSIELVLSRFTKSRGLQISLFLVIYSLIAFLSVRNFPGLLETYPYISKTKWVGFAVIWFICSVPYFRNQSDHKQLIPFTALLCIPVLHWISAPSSWERSKPASLNSPREAPSFFLLSFDSIPGDFFSYEHDGISLAPHWKSKWKAKGAWFENAYTVTNSTYTSWFATLTGKMPLETGVASLYPNDRTGNATPGDWLPAQLKTAGYRTIFMTDCSNTSFMTKESGFDSIYQPDRGAFGSTKALIESVHLGLYPLTQIPFARHLFPGLSSFSSHQYNESLFFNAVSTEYEELKTGKAPFFFVVHSCLTHRDMGNHLPAENSLLRTKLPEFPPFESKKLAALFLGIRAADEKLEELFGAMESSHHPLWRFFLSDHGIRLDPKGPELSHFSHGIGDAVSRHQYNVPFQVIPPSGVSFSNSQNDLVTIQDLAAFIRMNVQEAKEKVRYPVRPNLILTSAVPSEYSEDWGKTLLPLIRQGILDSDGTFRFSARDENHLNKNRPIAFLEMPFRYVKTQASGWTKFNEFLDPFHQTPMKVEKNLKIFQFLSELQGMGSVSLKEDSGIHVSSQP